MKICRHRRCNNPVEGRDHYCSDQCRYWEGVLRKEDNRGLPPKKYRTDKYFSMVTGSRLGSRGQGRRSGSMVKGGMSSVLTAIETITEVTNENLKKHFSHDVHTAYLCGGGRITREDFEKMVGGTDDTTTNNR